MNLKSLENIVPPLPICRQLKPEDFNDSTAIHVRYSYHREKKKISEIVVLRNELNMGPIPPTFFETFSAPATDEIMAELPLGTILQQDAPGVWVCIVHGGEPGIMIEKADKAATAALLIWLRLNGKEVKG